MCCCKQKTAYEMRISDWSSDVCSSDLRPAAPVDAKAAAPEKVDTVQAVPAVDTAQKPALTPAAPNSALTTYKDQDSGRLIVRVYDRESGDVLVEFPPEKAFRSEDRREGKECVRPCSYRGCPNHKKKNNS